MLDAFNKEFYPLGEKKIKINVNQIEALKPTNEELKDQEWTSYNEKRVSQGYESREEEGMNKIYISQGMVDVEELGTGKDDEV